jgi:hypothetical protein
VHNKYHFPHEDSALELHVVLCWVKVDQEGQPFEVVVPTFQPPTARELPCELRRAIGKKINQMRHGEFEVDDANNPAPEIVPNGTNP